jgi:transposase InsO family protein
MRLNEVEFRDWCRKNQVTQEAELVIGRIRSSEPSRRVKSGSHSVSGTFPSRKMGVTIQYESHKNELPFIHELEHDPEVLEFYDQPCQIKLNYLSKTARKTGVLHTPDFFVIKQNEAFFVECKTEEHLLELTIKTPNRFKLDESGNWICPPGNEYAQSLGLNYYVRSDKETGWIFQRNIEFLDDYYRNDNLPDNKDEYAEILEIIKNNPAITLEQLFSKIEKTNPSSRDDVHTLIVTDAIYVDLHSYLLTEPQNVLLYANKEVADAYSNVIWATSQDNHEIIRPDTLSLAPNKEILWDGRAWKIVNIGESEITLMIDKTGSISEIELVNFEKLILNGKIQELSEQEKPESQEHLNILLEASQDALAEANKRLNYVLLYLNDSESKKDFPFSERTIKRWVKAYRISQLAHGRGYYGLIPKPNNGNSSHKIHEESKSVLEKFITKDFENLKSKDRKTVHRAYKAECEKRGIIPASYVTFCKYVRKRPKDIQMLKRKGKRAAYQYEKFYWLLEPDTPKHGERPFHIAHVDHTELDIELKDSVTGKNMGRPWLTFLIDAFTRRILALYLTFEKPSKISCMMVLRECVRRHGRLPQILVVDGGKDFSSTYFETLMAFYEVTKKTRPPAKSRFGSVIERLFRTNDTQFIHNLQGNTQITKNVRQVTKSNNPKNNAIWNLGRLFDRLCEWAYTVYDQTPHSTLGQSPQEAFARGIHNSGKRSHIYIPYDESFKMITLPSPPKGTAKIDYTKGVKINTIFYWSNEFRSVGVAGKSLCIRKR